MVYILNTTNVFEEFNRAGTS